MHADLNLKSSSHFCILENETVESRPNSHEVGDGFHHLVAHALSCTLESEDMSIMGYGGLRFVSLDEVIKVEDLVWLDVSNGVSSGAGSTCRALWLGRAKMQ